MDEMICTENLTKRFGTVNAVDGLSLSVPRGTIYGFLGLNGAGKTTTIRMLLGMIRPTAGSARIKSMRVDASAYSLWNDVGYLVETPSAYPDLTVEENLQFVCRLRGIEGKKAIGSVIEQLKLGEYARRKARHLSLGNAQRLGLAKAMLHEPQVLLLDEPANGLDPAGIVEIRELLTGMAKERGVTILISSHILGEISKIASRIGIIHRGKLVREVDSAELHELLHKRLLVDAPDRAHLRSALQGTEFAFSEEEGGVLVTTDGRALAHPEEVSARLAAAGCPPSHLEVEVEELEAFFLRTIGGGQ